MRAIFIFLSLIYSALASAQTFSTLNEYVAYLTKIPNNDQLQIESVSTTNHIYGAATWMLSHDEVTYPQKLASIFILEKMGNGQLSEKVHSVPSNISDRSTIDEIEIKSNEQFNIYVFHSSPLGRDSYHFIKRAETWRVSGQDCESLFMNEDNGDEAVGDSRTETSINYLNSKIIVREYKANKLFSTKQKKLHYQEIPLSKFNFESIDYGC